MSNRTKLSYEKIAQKSGLSISTVSRVFNRSQSVSEDKRHRIIEALRELGADPSTLDLKPQPRNNMLIFNVPSLKNPFYSPIIEAAGRCAKRFGYNMVVSENPLGADLQSFINLIRTSKAAGVILSNAIVPETVDTIRKIVPVVTCCESATTAGVPYVTVDDESASENAVNYLISLGRRRIALINGPVEFKYSRERYKGYKSALLSHGFEIDQDIICAVGADMDYDIAVANVTRMLARPDRPDAFFCISDVLACAAIKASLAAGLRVPQDVAVVGFDNIQFSRMMNPSITTVCQPFDQLGTLAAEMLVRVLNGEDEHIESIHLGCELIIRESTSLFR